MPTNKKPPSSAKNNISISGDVKDSAVIIGDNNTVNQTFFQKVINIFKSDSETLEQRNRRILLNHVENAWIKGVLDASLHGAALLDLGIKQDPEAVTKYPWAIKKESTDETLPAGTSMLEIFDSIGMGRSLLILGAPGSGKTTMLLELARQLIARAREDVIAPIPMVFNLASWTEKLSLADWLAQELNNLYSAPRKTAPDWIKGDKLLLLLDGLDEVRQESRTKCVEAINEFRKEHGLTSLAVCSRSQDYADLNAKLSFEGAIEVQPLTQGQITEFFNRFGNEMAGIKQVLKKDSALREMAETPLFLSIMVMAYRDKQDVDILAAKDEKVQRKHLFDTYIERMFERPRSKDIAFKKQNDLNWLSWLAKNMVEYNLIPYLIERTQPNWLGNKKQIALYRFILIVIFILIGGIFNGLFAGLFFRGLLLNFRLSIGLIGGMFGGLIGGIIFPQAEIKTFDRLNWSWEKARLGLVRGVIAGLIIAVASGLIIGLIFGLVFGGDYGVSERLKAGLVFGLIGMMFSGIWFWKLFALIGALGGALISGVNPQEINIIAFPGQKIIFSIKISFMSFLLIWLLSGLGVGLIYFKVFGTFDGDGFLLGLVFVGPILGLIASLLYGGTAVIQHYVLRLLIAHNNLLPWRLVPFLDHCVDLIFLRRVGGGYIFVHRLLMEHFAEMYVETPTSMGN